MAHAMGTFEVPIGTSQGAVDALSFRFLDAVEGARDSRGAMIEALYY